MSYFLSRIDRSVADNLRDIETSFGPVDSGIVKDFIIFMNRKLRADLFGFSRFTLNEFCRESGRNKQDLCAVHPHFIINPKAHIPEYYGHKFETVIDYALFNMLSKNIIFSKDYNWNSKEESFILQKFSILKDIKITIDKSKKGTKVYEVRLSDDMMVGFIKRYYTLDTNFYKFVGKGIKGDGRKSLYIFLYKTRHICITKPGNGFKTRFSVDYLCSIAGITGQKSFHRKQSLERVLITLQTKGQLPFNYNFQQGDINNPFQEAYWVELDYFVQVKSPELIEMTEDNSFFLRLFEYLTYLFNHNYSHYKSHGEKDLFQRFIANKEFASKEKAEVLKRAYNNTYKIEIPLSKAIEMVQKGIFTENIQDYDAKDDAASDFIDNE